MVLFIQNKEATRQLPGVVTRLDIPPDVLRLDSTSNQMTDNISGGCTVQHVMHLSAKNVSSAMSIKAQVSFTDASLKACTAYVNISLAAGDFLRPKTLSTEQFGSMWGSTGSERKQKLAGLAVKTAQDFMDLISTQIHLHPVQIIGTEAICAGQVLADGNRTCLAHGKLMQSGVELTVRSSSTVFSEAVIRHFAASGKA